MSRLKISGRESKKSLSDKIQIDKDYEFKDTKTNEVQDPDELIDKSILTKWNGMIKKNNDDDIEWDSLIIELDDDAEYANSALPVILASFDNPNFVWFKNQGRDKKPTTNEVRGERPTLFDLHKDAHGYHLHLKTFRWSYDGKGNTANCPMDNSVVAEAQLEYTNKKLAEAGLSPIGSQVKDISTNNRPSEETKTEAAQISMSKLDINQVIEKIKQNTNYDETVIDNALEKDEKDLANFLNLAKIKQQEINNKKAAKELHANNNRLLVVVDKLSEDLKLANLKTDEKIVEIEQLQLTIEGLTNSQAADKDLIRELRDDISAKEQELSDLADNVKSLEEQIEDQASFVQAAATQIKDLKEDKAALELKNGALSTDKQVLIEEKFKWLEEKGQLQANENQFKHTIEQLTQAQKDAQDRERIASIKAQEEENKRKEVEATNARLQAELSEARKHAQDNAAELHKAATELEQKNGQLKAITTAYEAQKQEISDISTFVDYINEQLTKAASFIKKISTSLGAAPKAEANNIVKGYEEYKKEILNDTNIKLPEKLRKMEELNKKYNKTPVAKAKDDPNEPDSPNRPKLKK